MSKWWWHWSGFELSVEVSWPWRFVSVGFYAALQPGVFHHFHLSLGCLAVDLSHEHGMVE